MSGEATRHPRRGPCRPNGRRRRPWHAGAAVAVLVILWMAIGCGLKASPVPPARYRPPAPADVQYTLDDDTLVLSWPVPAAAEQGAPIEGCRVYRAARNIGEDACPGCPAPFAAVADLPLESADQKRQSYRENLQPGFLYAYKIACYTGRDNLGKESQPVYVQFDQ